MNKWKWTEMYESEGCLEPWATNLHFINFYSTGNEWKWESEFAAQQSIWFELVIQTICDNKVKNISRPVC